MNPEAVIDIPAIRHLMPDLPAGTVRWWASLGLLDPRGTDQRGRRLYRLGDVICLRAGVCALTDGPVVANTRLDRRGMSAA